MLAHTVSSETLSELSSEEIEVIFGGDGTIVIEDCTPGVAPTYKED